MDYSDYLDLFNETVLFMNNSINKSNNSNHEVIYPSWSFTKLDDAERTIFFILYLIVFSLSMIGNIATLFTTYQRNIRLVQKILIISLAISDIVVCVSYGINNMINFSHAMTNWILGRFMCSFVPYVQHLGPVANAITMVLIALDRYKSIVHPTNKQWNPNIWLCILLLIGIWGFSAAVAYPMFILNYLSPIDVMLIDPLTNTALSTEILHLYICTSTDKRLHQIFYITMFCLIFIPLMALFLWLYYKIAQLIWRRRKPLSEKTSNTKTKNSTSVTVETSTDSKTSVSIVKLSPVAAQTRLRVKATKKNNLHMERKIRTFKIILIIMAVFFVCRMPHYILNVIRFSSVTSLKRDWIIANAFSFLLILNTTLNPFLYSFLNQTIMYFDKFFISIGDFISHICCCCCYNSEFDDFEKDNPFSHEKYEQRNHSQSSSIVHKGPYIIKDQYDKPQGLDVDFYPNDVNSLPTLKNYKTF